MNVGDIKKTVQMGAVYVLSLPSFHWHRQDLTPEFGRYMHSCNVVGKRQMVVVGGRAVTEDSLVSGTTHGATVVDPWAQGLGIFDLSDLEWKASYDASASSYTTPHVVKTHIEREGRFPPAWSDTTVKTWFTKERTLFSISPHIWIR